MSDPFIMTNLLDGFLFGISNIMHPSQRRSLRAHYFAGSDISADDVVDIIKNLYAENGLIYDVVDVNECDYEDLRSALDTAVRQGQETIKEEAVDNLTKHILFRIWDFVEFIFDGDFRFRHASYSRYVVSCRGEGLKHELFSVRQGRHLLVLDL